MRGLHYFEAVARHQSVKKAAEEMGVSQSAISHQLRELTESLGEPLIARSGRGIVLTEKGGRLAEKLRGSFESLRASVQDVLGGDEKILRIAVCTAFGPGWLAERMKVFIHAHPEITVQFRLYAKDPEFSDTGADALITAATPAPGLAAVKLCDESLVAVISPTLSAAHLRFITTETQPGLEGADWRQFAASSGLDVDARREGSWIQSTHYLMALELARAGVGVALVPEFLVRCNLHNGVLKLFDQHAMPSGRTYNLCFKQSRRSDHAIQALLKWLTTELASRAAPTLKVIK